MVPFVLAPLPAVHLLATSRGGVQGAGRIGEDHEFVFVRAAEEAAARRAATAGWRGDGRPHIDALPKLEHVDGDATTLHEAGEGDRTRTAGDDE